MDDDVLMATFVLSVLVIVLGYLAFQRYLRHKEIMALAEKGLPYPGGIEGKGRETLRWGIVSAALGVALCLGLYPLGFFFGFPLNFGPWMLIGLLPTFFGLALILIHFLEERGRRRSPRAEKEETKD